MKQADRLAAMIQNVLTTLLSTLVLISPVQSQNVDSTTVAWQALQPKTFTVEKGETLGVIAQKVYGDSQYWTVLWADNTWIKDPNNLFSEWQLRVRDQKPATPTVVAKLPGIEATPVPKPAKPTVAPAQVATTNIDIAATPQASAPATPPLPKEAVAAVQNYRPSNYDDVYKAAGEQYGIPWQVLYGLHLTETGLRGGEPIYNKSGSGASGPMQFMPGTWRAYGVDGDGDGVANIQDPEDAIYGAANYLQKHGSLANGLRRYGGNYSGTIRAAQSRGWDASELN